MSKIALVHDQLTQYGGAERVLDVLHEIFPDAPIYTTVYLKDKLPEFYRNYDIRTTFIDKLPIIRRKHKLRAPLFPFGIQRLNLEKYDVIISDTQGIAKGVKTNRKQYHLSYVHTIPWFIWGLKEVKGRKFSQKIGRKWDFYTAQQPNLLLANSKNTQERIRKHYHRLSEVVYPPVEIEKLRNFSEKEIPQRFQDLVKENYIIFVGRLEGYKGEIELAQACSRIKQHVIIIGKGTNEDKLKNYSEYVHLINDASDEDLAILLMHAKALFNGSNEDFGINMVQALALGIPVLALGKGGALEIIEDGKSGLFIEDLSNEKIKEGIKKILELKIDKEYLMKSAERFDKKYFVEQIKKYIKEKIHE